MWQIQKGFALESRQPNPANTVQKLISANSQNDQPTVATQSPSTYSDQSKRNYTC